MDYFSTIVENSSFYMMHGASDGELWSQVSVMKPKGDMKVRINPQIGSATASVEFRSRESHTTPNGSSEVVNKEIFWQFPKF